MKPPAAVGSSEYENQRATATSDQGQQPSGRVTKAEQEKPLTANHCIDPQARPLTTSRSAAPASIPAHRLACILRFIGLYARTHAHTHTCTDKKHYLHIRPCGVSGPVVDLPVTFPSADSAMWIVRFCPFALSEWHQAPPLAPTPHYRSTQTKLDFFSFLSGAGLRADIRILTCFHV